MECRCCRDRRSASGGGTSGDGEVFKQRLLPDRRRGVLYSKLLLFVGSSAERQLAEPEGETRNERFDALRRHAGRRAESGCERNDYPDRGSGVPARFSGEVSRAYIGQRASRRLSAPCGEDDGLRRWESGSASRTILHDDFAQQIKGKRVPLSGCRWIRGACHRKSSPIDHSGQSEIRE